MAPQNICLKDYNFLMEMDDFHVSHVLREVDTVDNKLSNIGVLGLVEDHFELMEDFSMLSPNDLE